MDAPVVFHVHAAAAAPTELQPAPASAAEASVRRRVAPASGQARSRARARAALAALAVFLAVPIWWGADGRFPWDVDNIAPGSTLKAMAAGFGPGWSSSYGPVPYLTVGAAYTPALLLMRAAGELGHPRALYPWGFAHPGTSMLILVVLARLVSTLLALGVAWLAVRDARARAPHGSAAAAPLLLLGSATFAYYGRSTNVDIHALFWTWLGFHLVESPAAGRRILATAAVAATLAVCCKEQTAPLAAVIVAAAMVRAWRARPGGGGPWAAAAVGLAALAAYAVVWRLPWGWPGWLEHHRFIFTEARYPRSFPLSIPGAAGLAAHCAALFPLALGWVSLAAIAAAVALRVSWHGLGLRALGCGLYLVAFVGAIGYVYPRFLLLLLVVAIPLGARAVLTAELRLRLRPRARGAAAVAMLGLVMAGGPALGIVMLEDPRLAVERWLRRVATLQSLEVKRVEIAGNPHFQARIPRGVEMLRASPEEIRRHPRPPRGDIVLFSSVDAYGFDRHAAAIGCWLRPLRSGSGPYERIAFGAPPLARLVRGLPVAPAIEAYVRRRTPVAVFETGT